jgi:hypothetical protein
LLPTLALVYLTDVPTRIQSHPKDIGSRNCCRGSGRRRKTDTRLRDGTLEVHLYA